MTISGTVPSTESWTEKAYITITKAGGTDRNFRAITDTIDIDWGEKAIESIANCAGGRIVKYTPETDTVIKLELVPTGTNPNATTHATGLSQWFLGSDADVTQPLWTASSTTRYKFRVAILWTSDTTPPSSAVDNTAASTDSLRFSFWGCYLTSCKFSFTDDMLTCSAECTCPPFNKAGTGMIIAEEGDNTALPTLGTYSKDTTVPA